VTTPGFASDRVRALSVQRAAGARQQSRSLTPDLATLVSRTALGDRRAFRFLFEATRAQLFGICLRLLRDRGRAEEALQDTFVRIWRHAATYSGTRAQPMTWLITIARNRCLEIVRRRSADDGAWDEERAQAQIDNAATPEERSIELQEARAVSDCLRTLEDAERGAIQFAFFDGLAYSAVAIRLGRPLGTVKSQIRRGLARLRACLERA